MTVFSTKLRECSKQSACVATFILNKPVQSSVLSSALVILYSAVFFAVTHMTLSESLTR